MSSFSPRAGKTQEQSEWEQLFECNLTPISSLIYIYPQLHVPVMSPLISKYHRIAVTILAPVSKEIFTPPRRGRAKAQIQFALLRFSQHALLSLPAWVVCLSVTTESSHWKTAGNSKRQKLKGTSRLSLGMQQCQKWLHFSRLLKSLTFPLLSCLRGHRRPLYEKRVSSHSCPSHVSSLTSPPVFFLHHRVCSATVWRRSIFRNETEERRGEGVRGVMTGWRVKGGAGFRKALLCGWPCQIDWWEKQACVLGSLGIHPPGWADTLI